MNYHYHLTPYMPNWRDRADGRFVNHFYDAQDGGKGYTAYNALQFQDVLTWTYTDIVMP